MKAFYILLSGFLISGSALAQSECGSFHRKECGNNEGVAMRYDSQSKSAIMAKGQTSEFHMVAYNGLDYRISVCADELIGSEVQFKIYEKDRVLIKHEEPEITEEPSSEAYAEETTEDYSEDDSYSDNTYSDDSYSDDSYSDDSYSDAYGGGDPYGQPAQAAPVSNEPKFKIVKELLYDNAEDGYSNFLEFTAEGSKSLIIEVTIPGDGGSSKLKIREMGCVGVLIEHTKSRHSGF